MQELDLETTTALWYLAMAHGRSLLNKAETQPSSGRSSHFGSARRLTNRAKTGESQAG